MQKIIFGGESLKNIPKEKKELFSIHSPINRGQLDSITVTPYSSCLVVILDGVYGSSLSITPTECKDFIRRGGTLIGASSMGALRASELWSIGMIGMGNIYHMFRLGYLRSDADVAVAYNNNYEEMTVSIVHIRAILAKLEIERKIESDLSRRLLLAARQIIWFERYWDNLIEDWIKHFNLNGDTIDLANFLFENPLIHPKKIDALSAINLILSKRWPVQ